MRIFDLIKELAELGEEHGNVEVGFIGMDSLISERVYEISLDPVESLLKDDFVIGIS